MSEACIRKSNSCCKKLRPWRIREISLSSWAGFRRAKVEVDEREVRGALRFRGFDSFNEFWNGLKELDSCNELCDGLKEAISNEERMIVLFALRALQGEQRITPGRAGKGLVQS